MKNRWKSYPVGKQTTMLTVIDGTDDGQRTDDENRRSSWLVLGWQCSARERPLWVHTGPSDVRVRCRRRQRMTERCATSS